MIIDGRTISGGRASGRVLRLDEPLSFLGGVDGSTGELRVGPGGSVAGRVLVFPRGKGSTVGSFVMYDLMVHGKAPAAVVNESAETIVATGAVISSIPMVDSVPSVSMFEDGDEVVVDADAGTVEIIGVELRAAVSSVVERDGRILMLKRPDACRSFPGRWSLVSGRVEPGESPEQAAPREILEETGIRVGEPDAVLPVRHVREGSVLWEVHPFLYRMPEGEPVLNGENVAFEWAYPSDVPDMGTVDGVPGIVSDAIGNRSARPSREAIRRALRIRAVRDTPSAERDVRGGAGQRPSGSGRGGLPAVHLWLDGADGIAAYARVIPAGVTTSLP